MSYDKRTPPRLRGGSQDGTPINPSQKREEEPGEGPIFWKPSWAKKKRHHLSDCSEDGKKEIVADKRKEREERRKSGGAKRVIDRKAEDDMESCVIFSCTYAGRTCSSITADTGAEVKLMDSELLGMEVA